MATGEINDEQKRFLARLNAAIEQINEADKFLAANSSSPVGVAHGTAMFLSVIAKLLVMQTAEKNELSNRLLPFQK